MQILIHEKKASIQCHSLFKSNFSAMFGIVSLTNRKKKIYPLPFSPSNNLNLISKHVVLKNHIKVISHGRYALHYVS